MATNTFNPYNIHSYIVDIAYNMGYTKSEDGLCQGITHMGRIAALGGHVASFNARINELARLINEQREKVFSSLQDVEENLRLDLKQFFNEIGLSPSIKKCRFLDKKKKDPNFQHDQHLLEARLDKLITQHQELISSVIQEIEKDRTFNFRSFFYGIELCQTPNRYPFLCEKGTAPKMPRNDPQILEFINSLILSEVLEKKGGIASLVKFSGVYNSEEMTCLFKELREILDDSKCLSTIAIELSTINHTVSVAYDIQNKHWLLINSNELPIEIIKTDDEIVEHIKKEFNPLILTTEIFSSKEDSIPLTEALKLGFRKEVFQTLHKPTPEKAAAHDIENLSWLHLITTFENNAQLVKALLQAGADPNLADTNGLTPLLIATQSGNLAIVQALLQAGANPLLAHTNGATPLHMAVQLRYAEILQAFLDTSIEFNLDSQYKSQILSVAAVNNDAKIINILLSNEKTKVNPNIYNSNGTPPLFLAIHFKHLEAVKALVDGGADPLITYMGETLLDIAKQVGSPDIVEFLSKKTTDKKDKASED